MSLVARCLLLFGSLLLWFPVQGISAATLTTTTLKVATSDLNSLQVRATATVQFGDATVSAGTVLFSVNGRIAGSAQVAGPNAAPDCVAGTAQLFIPVPPGTYTLTARYVGTAVLSSSVSNAVVVARDALTAPRLDLQRNLQGSFSYRLNTLDGSDLSSSITLQDVTASQKLSSVDLSGKRAVSTIEQRDLSLSTRATSLAYVDLLGVNHRDMVVADATTGSIATYIEQQDLTWKVNQTMSLAGSATAIAIADFNGDGLTDVAVTNATDGTVSIFLRDRNNPQQLLDPAPIKVGAMPIAVSVGDFDRDGLPDLAVANFGANTVTILLNSTLSPGAFQKALTLATQSGPSAIAVGDFHGNGSTDVAVTSYYEGTVAVYSGDPDDQNLFTTPSTVNFVGQGPTSMIAVDVNGDNLLDLVVCNSLDGTVSILKGIPTFLGSFPEQQVVSGFVMPTSVSPALRTSAAPRPDLVIADSGDGTLTLLLNDGSGLFSKRIAALQGASVVGGSAFYDFSSGSYALEALDPSFGKVHFVNSEWSRSGQFSVHSTQIFPVPHTLQSEIVLPSTGLAVASNSVIVPATTKQQQSITFGDLSPIVYGAATSMLHATSTSGLAVQFSIVSGSAQMSGARIAPTSVGIIRVRAEQPGDDTYAAALPVDRYLSVLKAPLTIKPLPASRPFGKPNPTFTGVVSGLVGDDSVNVTYVSEADGNTPAGSYNSAPLGITARISSSIAQNYSVTASVGTLTICPRRTTIASSANGVVSCALASSDHPESTDAPTQNQSTQQAGNSTIPGSSGSEDGAGTQGTSQGQSAPTPVLSPGRLKPHPVLSQSQASAASPGSLTPIRVPVQGGPVLPQGSSPKGPWASGWATSTSTGRPAPTVPWMGPKPTSGGSQVTESANSEGPVSVLKPTVPPRRPGKGGTKHPTLFVPLPIPVGGPVLGLPSGPHLTVGLPSFSHTAISVNKEAATSLLFLEDGRGAQLLGWTRLLINLNCPASAHSAQTVLVSQGDSVVQSVLVRVGEDAHALLRHSENGQTELTAHFAGSDKCGATQSRTITVKPGETGEMPVTPSDLYDLIPLSRVDQIAPKGIDGKYSGSSAAETSPADTNSLLQGSASASSVPW